MNELLDDLDHIYRFDKAYKKYVAAKRNRVLLLAVMFAASIALMVSGYMMMGQEKETAYGDLLAQASELYTSDYAASVALLDQARAMFPDRIEPDRQQTYALYLNGQWQACVDLGTQTLADHGEDVQTRLAMASAQFELGDYEAAAEGFAQGGDLSVDSLRDYAVCLGRLGHADQAEAVLADLVSKGAEEDVTIYVQGEVYFAQENYIAAEEAFLATLERSDSDSLKRRCYISLGDLYRDCAALARTGASPIRNPASKSAELLSQAVVLEALRYDSALWEMLALAYFESFHTDIAAPDNYLQKAADCFNRVIELGVVKEYLYTNLYTIYYEMGNYTAAEQALAAYENAYPADYMPHALRGMMLITIENNKPQNQRDFSTVLAEYETAGSKIRSSDETTYYQQLGSLIDSLRQNGWL